MNAEVVQAILGEVRARTGVDFSRYRPATVERRIANRMISVGAGSPECYLGLLRASRDEARHLLNRISIKVSRFYRYAPAYDVLRHSVLPALAARGAPLRLWSAGCGCGEEPWTLAMLLDAAGLPGTVLATDIDCTALGAAQVGLYQAQAADELPAELRARYLAELRQRKRAFVGVREALRRRVRFVRHDLLFAAAPEGAPFDLVACRNVLIYLQPESREEALRTLTSAVRPGGYLCLGEAEWSPERVGQALEPLSRQGRVFQIPALPA